MHPIIHQHEETGLYYVTPRGMFEVWHYTDRDPITGRPGYQRVMHDTITDAIATMAEWILADHGHAAMIEWITDEAPKIPGYLETWAIEYDADDEPVVIDLTDDGDEYADA